MLRKYPMVKGLGGAVCECASVVGVATLRAMAILFIVAALMFVAQKSVALDCDLDNDGWRDWNCGGSDGDLDNDGWRDYDAGGSDGDLDNDGWRDSGAGGSDCDLDNDGWRDWNCGGSDHDLDNDGWNDH